MGLIPGIGVMGKPGASVVLPAISQGFNYPVEGLYNVVRVYVYMSGANINPLEAGICWNQKSPPGEPWTTPPKVTDSKSAIVNTVTNFSVDFACYGGSWEFYKISAYVKSGNAVAYAAGHFAEWNFNWFATAPSFTFYGGSGYMSNWEWFVNCSFNAASSGNYVEAWLVQCFTLNYWGNEEYQGQLEVYGSDTDFNVTIGPCWNGGTDYFCRFYYRLSGHGWIHAGDSSFFYVG